MFNVDTTVKNMLISRTLWKQVTLVILTLPYLTPSDRLIQVKTIKSAFWNPRKGDRLKEDKFTVNKGSDFRDFDNALVTQFINTSVD